MSPPTKVKEPKTHNQKRSAPPPAHNSTNVQAKHSNNPPEPEGAPDGTPSGSFPARRIRRPAMIRRPKLVGKSFDGAAMQAVAASRKRASTNQFKKVASTVPTRRPSALTPLKEGGRGSITKASPIQHDASSKRFGRRPTSSRRQKDRESEDDELTLIKGDFCMACNQKYWELKRQSSLQRESTLLLSNLWWPRQQDHIIPISIATFIVSKSPMAWSDACRFPPFPNGIVNGLVPIFARWITTFAPGVQLLSTKSSSLQPQSDAIFLASNIKNVRGRKCLVVIKLSKIYEKKSLPMVRCQGWVSVLPRRSRRDLKVKPNANITSSLLLEKDSAGLDKLSSDVHVSSESKLLVEQKKQTLTMNHRYSLPTAIPCARKPIV